MLELFPLRLSHFVLPILTICTTLPTATLAQTPTRVGSNPVPRAATPRDSGLAQRRELPWRFAVIGDFGDTGLAEAQTAELVRSYRPDFILTLGDNNYPNGEASTIDTNIGQYYHQFIYPYLGIHGPGATENRFFPSLGNHDWNTTGAQPHLDYFSLPGNERYYDFVFGPAHFFALDSDTREPDGVDESSVQAQWLQQALAASTSKFNVVYMHHAPYSSSAVHGITEYMLWPFEEWGADLVMAGHDHIYERLLVGSLTYMVNGLGGRARHSLGEAIAGSQLRYDDDHGALLGELEEDLLSFSLVTRAGVVVDMFAMTPGGVNVVETELVPFGFSWRYLDDGSDQGTAWSQPAFVDGAWASGSAELGYGDGDEATVVSFGPNPSSKFITTYFRSSFNVVDPSSLGGLKLRLKRDDGAVVYLNGVEALSSNMPGGAIDYLTLAASSISGDEEITVVEAQLDCSLLTPGDNHLAVEVHQRSITSSDISFDLELTATIGTPLVAPGAVWRYLDDGSQPAASWNSPAFDDTLWSSGPAILGYGDGDEATVVSFGPDPNDKFITTYFRKSFNVPDASAFGTLLLRALRDDGVAVYLNGKQVFRNNLQRGGLTESVLAADTVGGANERIYLETNVDPRLLVDGTNVIAVEVHQASVTSTDLSFDLVLLGF